MKFEIFTIQLLDQCRPLVDVSALADIILEDDCSLLRAVLRSNPKHLHTVLIFYGAALSNYKLSI